MSVRLQWKEEYPSEPPLIELKSNTLLDSVLNKLEKAAIAFVSKNPNSPCLVPLLQFFENSIVNNKLLYAKEELDEVHSLLKEGDEIKLNYKKGSFLITQREGKYVAKFRVLIPDDYPISPVTFAFLSNNFHPKLTATFNLRVQSLIDRVLQGYKYNIPSFLAKKEEVTGKRPTVTDLQDIRHDLQFLHKVQDLKEQSNDKKSRREHVRLLKAEAGAISGKEKKQKEKEEALEEQKLQMQRASDRRTLFPVVGFIMKELVLRLPTECCAECQKGLLPKIPPTAWSGSAPIGEMEEKYRIERLTCDHWYHFACLEEIMSRPPFDDKKCLVDSCTSSIEHTFFNIKYIRAKERKWLKSEERKRELADICDFMS